MRQSSFLSRFSTTELNAILFIFFWLVILMPYGSRYLVHHDPLAGDESYYHLRLAQAKSFIVDDNALSSRHVLKNPFQLALTGMESVAPSLIILLPLLLAALFMYAVFLLQKNLNMSHDLFFYMMLVFILSPPVLYSFFMVSEIGFYLSFLTLALALLLQPKRPAHIAAMAIMVMLSMFSFHSSLLLLSVLVLIRFYRQDLHQRISFALYATVICSFFFFLFLPHYIRGEAMLPHLSSLQEHIADFGATIGLSAFQYVLAFFGFLLSWSKKQQHTPFYLMLVLWLILQNNTPISYLALSLFFSYFAAYTFVYLSQRHWDLSMLKNITLLLLFCGVLFSGISYSGRLSASSPHKGFEEAMVWLKTYSHQQGTVFSHYSRGNWIAGFSGMPIILDTDFASVPDWSYRLKDSDTVMYSRNIDITSALLRKYEVSYIVMDDELKNMLFHSNDEGLLFLFKNEATFDKLYYKDGILIYRFIYPTSERQ